MDPVGRSAARTATFVALPVAVIVALVSLFWFGGFSSPNPTPADAPSAAVTGPVTMDALPLADDAVAVCQTVVSHLPDTVAGRARRPVSAGPEQNAAYGEPAITVTCGTPLPSFPPTSDVFPLSGVCWYAAPGDGVTVWTTVDRTVPVTVRVPGPSEGSAQLVVPFSAAVAGGDPVRDTYPAGCRG